MKLYNIKNPDEQVSLAEAIKNGAAQDGGLYMPDHLPLLNRYFLRQLKGKSFEENAFIIARKIFGEEFTDAELRSMTQRAFPFEVPLKQVDDAVYALELFHGPTMAFKDVGAGFMAQMLKHFVMKQQKQAHILVATSGDTGGAVAEAFKNAEGIKVSIFYPSGRVSRLQEQQLNPEADNIQAYRVNGTFDDCQSMVKRILKSKQNNKHCFYTTANSINVGRMLPQIFYYFHALSQLPSPAGNIVCAVPSGNFGNLCAGLLAKKMGLGINNFIAATNLNDTVPRFFKNGKWLPKATISTLSNAMDISVPNNFDRILHLYENNLDQLKNVVRSISVSEKQTTESINELYYRDNYLACPHTAVAAYALKQEMQRMERSCTGIFLSTAHPLKFEEVYGEIMPEENIFYRPEKSVNELRISPKEVESDFIL